MQISGTLQAGLNIIPDASYTMMSTGVFDEKRLSDLSIGDGTIYPGGHVGLDADESTVGLSDTTGTHAAQKSQKPVMQASKHNNSLAFNPLFDEAESGLCGDNSTKGEAEGTVTPLSRSMTSTLPATGSL